MGFDGELNKLFDFVYRANLEDGLVEHEFDHVLVGCFEGVPRPDSTEVADWKWIDLPMLSVDLEEYPENYTYWFRISFDQFRSTLEQIGSNAASYAKCVSANA
jgi:isopentenyl-diphosphate delta-isomerase